MSQLSMTTFAPTDDELRAISCTNPWTGVMAAGIKPIENRTRPMVAPRDFGKRIALHSTREIDEDVYSRLLEIQPKLMARTCDCPEPGKHRGCHCRSARFGAPFASDDWCGCTCHHPDHVPLPDTTAPWYQLSRVTSAIIAVGVIDRVIIATGCHETEERFVYRPDELMSLGDGARWLFGRVGYVLRDVIALPTPVPCRGWQGFWAVPTEIARKVIDQLGTAT